MRTATFQHRRIVEHQDAYTSQVRWYDDIRGEQVKYDQFDPSTELVIASTIQQPFTLISVPRRVH